jgi:hypothetical protein
MIPFAKVMGFLILGWNNETQGLSIDAPKNEVHNTFGSGHC